MSMQNDIRQLVDKTPFVDTHEHLFEESSRITDAENGRGVDFGVLFWHYSDSDLFASGMSREEIKQVQDPGLTPREKWRVLEPHWQRSKNTGYLLNVRESIRLLYGIDDLREDTVDAISERLRSAIKPGYYRTVFRDVANIEYTQVNAIQADRMLFMETEQPDLLAQDLGFNPLSSSVNKENVAFLSEYTGIEVGSLKDFHKVQDRVFEMVGPRAIAMKNQDAYGRRLDYEQVSTEDAAPLFTRMVAGDSLNAAETKAICDHCFHRCIEKSIEYSLPVKLHTGYYAGNNGMPLHRVGANPGDICDLLRAHPNARFVLMHITWPYHDELVAICKHYSNAWADLCWAWIASPLASLQFVKEFIMAAPANKLLTFGGDYIPVEMVPGHAAVARRGLAQAVSELEYEGWVRESDVPDLVDRLMRGNAHELFDYEGTLAAWK